MHAQIARYDAAWADAAALSCRQCADRSRIMPHVAIRMTGKVGCFPQKCGEMWKNPYK